jgi:hypothetical protein
MRPVRQTRRQATTQTQRLLENAMKTEDYNKLKVGDEVVWYRRILIFRSKTMKAVVFGHIGEDWGERYELFQLPRDQDELLAALDSDIANLQKKKEQVIASCRTRLATEADPLALSVQ